MATPLAALAIFFLACAALIVIVAAVCKLRGRPQDQWERTSHRWTEADRLADAPEPRLTEAVRAALNSSEDFPAVRAGAAASTSGGRCTGGVDSRRGAVLLSHNSDPIA